MFLVKQSSVALPVKNIDELTGENRDGSGLSSSSSSFNYRNSCSGGGPLLPSNVRAILAGASGSGKTNVLFTLLCHPNGVKFKNLYVYSRSLQQPKYRLLECIMQKVPEVKYYTFRDNEHIISATDAPEHTVMIFDDVVCDAQSPMRDYFTRGRHKNISVFYLTQSYSKIQKQLIRDNANVIILFRQDRTNLHHVFSDHVSPDMSFEAFLEMCHEQCWKNNEYGFIVIDKESPLNKGRYRCGFDTYISTVVKEKEENSHRRRRRPSTVAKKKKKQ